MVLHKYKYIFGVIWNQSLKLFKSGKGKVGKYRYKSQNLRGLQKVKPSVTLKCKVIVNKLAKAKIAIKNVLSCFFFTK